MSEMNPQKLHDDMFMDPLDKHNRLGKDLHNIKSTGTGTGTTGTTPRKPPPSPTKTTVRSIGIDTDEHNIEQDDDDEEFLNFEELPVDVAERISQRTDGTHTQTQSSMTRFRNHVTVNANGKQREWNFILFPETSKETMITRSGFKVLIKGKELDKDKLGSWSSNQF